jgi:hypothetical protein
MGLSNFFDKIILKFYCDTFNRMYVPKPDEAFREMAEMIGTSENHIRGISQSYKSVILTLSGMVLLLKQSQRQELKPYTVHQINDIIQGRFELLAFMALHGGNRTLINTYCNDMDFLFKQIKFVHEYLTLNSPNSITLNVEELYNETIYSLHRTKKYFQ